MSFYVGVNGVAKNVKNFYVGVNGVSRKIKKFYVGVQNIARKIFPLSPVEKISTTITGSNVRNFATTKNGDYILFGGGESYSSSTFKIGIVTTCNCFNSSLTKVTKTLTTPGSCCDATTVGNYAVFGGGYGPDTAWTSSSDTTRSTANCLNQSLTSTTKSFIKRGEYAATTIGNYGLFGGGYAQSGASHDWKNFSQQMYAINNSLTTNTVTSLSQVISRLSATYNSNYAIFAGGGSKGQISFYSSKDLCDCYNSSLTKTTSSYTFKCVDATSVSFNDYAIFALGYIISGSSTNTKYTYPTSAKCYNKSLTASTIDNLTPRKNLASTVLGDYALFGGGYNNDRIDIVEILDKSFTKTYADNLSVPRYELQANSIGNYALFVSGYDGNPKLYSNTIDVYQLV